MTHNSYYIDDKHITKAHYHALVGKGNEPTGNATKSNNLHNYHNIMRLCSQAFSLGGDIQ